MSKVTMIRWRPYPEQKPPVGYTEAFGQSLAKLERDDNQQRFGRAFFDGNVFLGAQFTVTHFALPEDVTTTEEP